MRTAQLGPEQRRPSLARMAQGSSRQRGRGRREPGRERTKKVEIMLRVEGALLEANQP
jgi:hypothetical protein